jgi:hypothetical protein
MNAQIKYYYANYLCATVEQYIDIISDIMADVDKNAAKQFLQSTGFKARWGRK